MLRTETVTYGGKAYIRTWNDNGTMIQRDGALYEEAVDPIDSGRTYTETDVPIVDASEAMAEDYESALTSLGVEFA